MTVSAHIEQNRVILTMSSQTNSILSCRFSCYRCVLLLSSSPSLSFIAGTHSLGQRGTAGGGSPVREGGCGKAWARDHEVSLSTPPSGRPCLLDRLAFGAPLRSFDDERNASQRHVSQEASRQSGVPTLSKLANLITRLHASGVV